MGKINLTINDELEREFREMAYKVKGMKKGFLTDATEEAIKVWLKSVKSSIPPLSSSGFPGGSIYILECFSAVAAGFINRNKKKN